MTQATTQLGLSGEDTQHIFVRMLPTVKAVNGQTEDTYQPSFPEGYGDLRTYNPTNYHFILVDEDGTLSSDWEFAQFVAHGRSWDGIMLSDPCGYTITFGQDHRHVIMHDACEKPGCLQKYTLVIRNTQTNELIVLDPGTSNDDRPGGGNGP